MLKKLYISSLVVILLISTTGLTYTFHLCKMMSEPDTMVCEMEHMKVQHSCCMNKNDGGQRITTYNPVCCEFKTVEKRVSDEFISSFNEKSPELISTFVFIPVDPIAHNFSLSDHSNFHPNNNSPPGRESGLFIFNSSFLI